MLHLDLKTAISLVDSVIEREGADKIYKAPNDPVTGLAGACLYVHPNEDGFTPGCIVGHVLIDFGIAPSHLDKIEAIRDLAPGLELGDILGIDADALDYLRVLQWEQDGGASWGYANKTARKWMGLDDAS